MFITRIDSEKYERVLERGILNRESGVKKLVALARLELEQVPNHPHLSQSGHDEVSIYIGISRVASFRLDMTEDEKTSSFNI